MKKEYSTSFLEVFIVKLPALLHPNSLRHEDSLHDRALKLF